MIKLDEPDIYVYKMIADNGGAPCVSGHLLSLAICKPKIRKSATIGALIFGFGGKKYHERLIYIARVTEKLTGRDYYRRREYARRADCIYRVVEGAAKPKGSARYHVHPDQTKKDVGLLFENASVLLSDDFRYLGGRGTNDYKHNPQYPKLGSLIAGLKRGHRRNHSPALRAELSALKAEIWRKYRQRRVGKPSDEDYACLCNTESPSAHC